MLTPSQFYQLDTSTDGDAGGGMDSGYAVVEADVSKIGVVTQTVGVSPDVLTLTQSHPNSGAAILAKSFEPYLLDLAPCASLTVSGIGSGLTLDIGAGSGADTFYFSSNFGAAQISNLTSYASSAHA